MKMQEALDRLDMAILADMNNAGSIFGRYDTYFHLRALGDPNVLSRDMVRVVCRSLTDRGFARYCRGLFNDEGMVAGSGYGITRKGHRYLCALEELYLDKESR